MGRNMHSPSRLLSFLLVSFAAWSTSSAAVLETFQVNQPVTVPRDAKQCTVRILQRNFSSSNGGPEVVQFKSPTDCGPAGSWAAITLSLSVTATGSQLSRLGHLTLQNVEIWRTSTLEPTKDGVRWTHVKDVTRFTPLFAKDGSFNFQMDGIAGSGLDGIYATTIQATFYESSTKNPPATKSDQIIPLTSSRSITLPRNVVKIFAEIQATGVDQEEFWYFNLPNKYLKDVPAGTAYGQGGAREVRLLVDGNIAGIINPYVTLQPGAFLPSVWKPVPSHGAFDIPSHFLDLTHFAPYFADGKAHTVAIEVISMEDDHRVLQSWSLAGALHVFLDPSGLPTTGSYKASYADQYPIALVGGDSRSNGEVNSTIATRRTVAYDATVVAGSGEVTQVRINQWLQFSSSVSYSNQGKKRSVIHSFFGTVNSQHNGEWAMVEVFSFPLKIDQEFSDGKKWRADIDHTYWRDIMPLPWEQRTTVITQQLLSGSNTATANGNIGEGTSNTNYTYSDLDSRTYNRHIIAVNNKITQDVIGGSLSRN